MSGHVFVDESKQRDHLLVAAAVSLDDLADARRALRALVMPGQRRLHMKKESRARRSAIIDVIMATGATASVYQTRRSGHDKLVAREACLRAVVADGAAAGHGMLTFEQGDSLLWWDRQRLVESPATSVAATPCITNTVAPSMSCCWRFPTRSLGVGRKAAYCAIVFGRLWIEPARSDPGSAKPGSPTVRTATGLTSRSSTQRA